MSAFVLVFCLSVTNCAPLDAFADYAACIAAGRQVAPSLRDEALRRGVTPERVSLRCIFMTEV